MDVNRAIDNLINNLEPLELSLPQPEVLPTSPSMSWRRIWIIYNKSEEDLDRLPQVGGGFGLSTTSWMRTSHVHQRAPISADYSDFIDNASPLSNSHQGLRAPSTWSGGLRHQKGKESTKLPDPS
jgi:hypothetical protein